LTIAPNIVQTSKQISWLRVNLRMQTEIKETRDWALPFFHFSQITSSASGK